MDEIQLPPLLKKVLEAHNSAETPNFSLPERSFLFAIQKNGKNEAFEAQLQSIPELSTIRIFPSSEVILFDRVSAPQKPFLIDRKELSVRMQETFDENHEFIQIIPISLISAAKGYLLLPGRTQTGINLFEQYFSFLGSLVEDCLFDQLMMRYTPEKLLAFDNWETLAEDFSETIAEWLCPISYSCNGRDIDYFREARQRVTDMKLVLSDGIGQEIITTFHLPTHGYPKPEFPDQVHQVDFVAMRSMYLKSRLTNFFSYLIQFWKFQLNSSFPLQLDQAIMEMKKTAEKAKSYKENLKDSISTLESIKVKLKRKTISPFSFYLSSKTSLWRVIFKGDDYSTRSSSPQGMASIQYLLSCPDEQIEALDLYEVVKKQGYTYATSNSDASVDPELDRANLIEAKNLFGKAYLSGTE